MDTIFVAPNFFESTVSTNFAIGGIHRYSMPTMKHGLPLWQCLATRPSTSTQWGTVVHMGFSQSTWNSSRGSASRSKSMCW